MINNIGTIALTQFQNLLWRLAVCTHTDAQIERQVVSAGELGGARRNCKEGLVPDARGLGQEKVWLLRTHTNVVSWCVHLPRPDQHKHHNYVK